MDFSSLNPFSPKKAEDKNQIETESDGKNSSL